MPAVNWSSLHITQPWNCLPAECDNKDLIAEAIFNAETPSIVYGERWRTELGSNGAKRGKGFCGGPDFDSRMARNSVQSSLICLVAQGLLGQTEGLWAKSYILGARTICWAQSFGV